MTDDCFNCKHFREMKVEYLDGSISKDRLCFVRKNPKKISNIRKCSKWEPKTKG